MTTLCRLVFMCMLLSATCAISETAYGTILPSCVLRLVRHFDFNEDDIVVDLGSGIGNVCRDVSPFVSTCVGYEVDEVRYNISQRLVSHVDLERNPYVRYTRDGYDVRSVVPTNIDFFLQDFRTLKFVQATIVIVHSTVFSDITMAIIEKIVKASPSVRLLLTQKPMNITQDVERVRCDFSWSKNSFIDHTMKGYKLK